MEVQFLKRIRVEVKVNPISSAYNTTDLTLIDVLVKRSFTHLLGQLSGRQEYNDAWFPSVLPLAPKLRWC
jgi:hypothetical protein